MKKGRDLNFKKTNCEHLANVNKQEHVKIINNRIGLSTPYIITPLQILYVKEEEECMKIN